MVNDKKYKKNSLKGLYWDTEYFLEPKSEGHVFLVSPWDEKHKGRGFQS